MPSFGKGLVGADGREVDFWTSWSQGQTGRRLRLREACLLSMLWLAACSGNGGAPDAHDVSDSDGMVLPGDDSGSLADGDGFDAGGEDGGAPDGDAGNPGAPWWGWISLLENPDTDPNEPAGWMTAGPRALFARGPCCRYVLEHHLESCGVLQASGGDCVLYRGFWHDESACDPLCQREQECVDEGGKFACRDLPPLLPVERIDIRGLKTAANMSLGPDGVYTVPGAADDMFDAGDAITVEVARPGLAPLSFAIKGVAPPQLASTSVELRRGTPATISWTPAEPGSRVQVFLSAGSHFPHLFFATILCQAPDEQGSLVVPPELVNGLLDVATSLGIRRYSRIVRTRSELWTRAGEEIELYLGSAKNLQIMLR